MSVSGRLSARSPLGLALAASLVLVACSGSPSGSAPPVPSGAISVEAKEYLFSPATISVPAGEVRFWIRNAGAAEHEFEIFKGEQVVGEIEGLVPGLAKELPLTLVAGAYTFACKLNGHDQLGMKGTLTVTGG